MKNNQYSINSCAQSYFINDPDRLTDSSARTIPSLSLPTEGTVSGGWSASLLRILRNFIKTMWLKHNSIMLIWKWIILLLSYREFFQGESDRHTHRITHESRAEDKSLGIACSFDGFMLYSTNGLVSSNECYYLLADHRNFVQGEDVCVELPIFREGPEVSPFWSNHIETQPLSFDPNRCSDTCSIIY